MESSIAHPRATGNATIKMPNSVESPIAHPQATKKTERRNQQLRVYVLPVEPFHASFGRRGFQLPPPRLIAALISCALGCTMAPSRKGYVMTAVPLSRVQVLPTPMVFAMLELICFKCLPGRLIKCRLIGEPYRPSNEHTYYELHFYSRGEPNRPSTKFTHEDQIFLSCGKPNRTSTERAFEWYRNIPHRRRQ